MFYIFIPVIGNEYANQRFAFQINLVDIYSDTWYAVIKNTFLVFEGYALLMIFISVLRKLSLLAGNNMVEFMSPIIVIDTANSAIG